MRMLRFSTLSAAPCSCWAPCCRRSAQQIVLKVHHMLPATSNPHLNVIQPWCDKINKESNDRLKCQIYPAMQLGGTPPQLFDQVKDGVVDIVWTVPTYSAGRFFEVGGVRAAVHGAQRQGGQPGALAVCAEERAGRVQGHQAHLHARARRLDVPFHQASR